MIQLEQLNLFTLPTPSMPKLNVSRCEARPISYETAANMVEVYHYAHRVPSIVASFGMYVDDVLAGCITLGIPPNNRAIESVCGEGWNGLELNRLFIHDWAGRNSESWFIGQMFSLMERFYPEYQLLLSYADPNVGHTGYIYQATNWLYLGAGTPGSGSPDSDMILDGEIFSFKKIYNIYGTHSVKRLREMGFDAEAIPAMRKHRYVYFLGDKWQRRRLHESLRWPILPYPKNGVSRPAEEEK